MIERVSANASEKPLFSQRIQDNSISAGEISLETLTGMMCFRVALVETAPGKDFPWQFHTGGDELAVVLEGQGRIEVREGENVSVVVFGSGDVLRIPPNITYRVCNDDRQRPLRARVFFPVCVHSYWPDGSQADAQEER